MHAKFRSCSLKARVEKRSKAVVFFGRFWRPPTDLAIRGGLIAWKHSNSAAFQTPVSWARFIIKLRKMAFYYYYYYYLNYLKTVALQR